MGAGKPLGCYSRNLGGADGSSDPCGCMGRVRVRGSECILKLKMKGFPDEMDIRWERKKSQNDSRNWKYVVPM